MRRFLTIIAGVGTAAAVAAAVTTEVPSWINAYTGVWVAGRLSAPGCAPATLGEDRASKVALMRAGAVLTGIRHGVSVSGRERIDNSRYTGTITETAKGELRPLVIIEQAHLTMDGQTLLCVLATEEQIEPSTTPP